MHNRTATASGRPGAAAPAAAAGAAVTARGRGGRRLTPRRQPRCARSVTWHSRTRRRTRTAPTRSCSQCAPRGLCRDGGEGSGGSPVPVHRPKEVQRGRLLPTYTKKQKKQKRRMLAGDPVFEVCTYAARASEDMPRRALSVLLLPRTVILPSLTNTVND